MIDVGWLTFQEDRPNVKTNPLANHGGGAVNAIESDRPCRSKPLKDVATPRRFIFEALKKGGVVTFKFFEFLDFVFEGPIVFSVVTMTMVVLVVLGSV